MFPPSRAVAVIGGEIVGEANGACPAIVPILEAEKLPNPGLEAPYSSGLANNWSKNSTPTVSEENTIIHGGSSSQKVEATAASQGLYKYVQTSLGVGRFVRISGWVYEASGGGDVMLQLNCMGDTHQLGPEEKDTWTYLERTGHMLTSSSTGPFFGQLGAVAVTGYLDDCSVKQITPSSMLAYMVTRPTKSGIFTCKPVMIVGTQCGMVIDYADENNFIMAYVDRATGTTRGRLITCLGGSWAVAVSGTVTYVSGAELKVTIDASGQATLYYNNLQVGSAATIVLTTLGRKFYGLSSHESNGVGLMTSSPFESIALAGYTSDWLHGNDGATYLYAVSGDKTTVLRRTQSVTALTEMGAVTAVDADYLISRLFVTTTANRIFALVYDEVGVYHLLRSTNGGATFANVLTLGAGNGPAGADTPGVRLLGGGFCECTADYPGGGGDGDYILGEYNNADPRTDGGENDRVRLMRSTDGGATWAEVWKWNSDGSTNQVRHIHIVHQDPDTGYVYIGTGDNNLQCGIIRWDGATDLTDNTPMSSINALAGFECLQGAQRYRTVGMITHGDYLFTYSDCIDAPAESGIWRWAKDLSAGERVNNDIYGFDPKHVGWLGLKTGKGHLIFMSGKDSGWAQTYSQVHASTDGGATWHVIGSIKWLDGGSTRHPVFFHTLGQYVYLDASDCVMGETEQYYSL